MMPEEFTQSMTDTLEQLNKVGITCTACSHFQVCSIFRGVAQMLATFDEKIELIVAKDLAKICKQFTPSVLTRKSGT